MAESIYDIYNKAIKEQQQLATPTAPLSVLDEIQAYRNQLASIRQAEEQKKVQQMSFGKRALQTAGDVFGTVGKGIAKGVEGIADAGRLLRANITDVDDIRANMKRKIAYDTTENSEYTQWLNRNTQGSYLNDTWLEGAIQSVGEMLPSVALNAIPVAGQALSTASFVTSAMGRGAEQALQEGATLEQATKYGVVSGTVEGIIEMASGGVAGVGSGWLSKAFPKVAGKVSTKLMTKPVTRVAMSMIGEGFEEVASELARPYMERIYKSKENIDPVTMENILQTFTIGALASGIMQGGMVAVTGRTNFRASLIEEQIQNINEKITQETEKGTITPEKSKAYAEQQEALLGQLEETLGATVVVKDTAQQQTTPTEVKQEEEPKEILSTKSNTGEVYRQGDYVYKNSFRGNEKTLEGEVYSALKNNDNVLSGEEITINGKQMIKTPYVENVISIDTIPLDDRKNYGEIFSRDDINNIVNAINELSLLGYDYSDALQFAYQDGKFKLFDFSNVTKKTIDEATKNNYMYLYNFLKAFGLDNYANKIGKGMRIRNLLQTYSRESVESGKAFVLKENERNVLKKLYRFNASPNNVYVTYNARTIPNVAQTDILENGYKYVYTEKPLSKQFIKEWELETLFETNQQQPIQPTTQTEQAQQETTTSVPQATESIISQETKTQTLTEGKKDTKQTKQTKKSTTQKQTQAKVEAPTEIKVVESLDDKLELIQDTDGKFNIRITGTDIRLTPKNNNENFMRGVYQQFKKEGTIDKIIESATRRTQSQTKEQESVKDDTKPKSKSSDSKTTKRATSKDTTRTSATVEQDVTTKQETKQAEEVKQETEQEQPQVKRTGKEIFAEAKTNKKIIYVEKSRYDQTVYEVINPDAVPQELQPLVEKAKQYNTGLMFFYEEAQNGVITEGLFNYKERAIMINLASETPYEIILTHEIGHRQVATNRIKFNEMYQRFTQLSTNTKAKINELFGVYKDFYEENAEFFGNRQLNEEALFEEFLCNLGAGQIDLDALGIEASELTTLKDFDTEFKAEYLGKALQMDDTKNVLEIEKKLKTMPKYSLRKQTVENPPVAESSTRGKVMVGNIKQKSTFGDTLTWVRRAFTNSMVDVENFFKRNGVANGEALTNKARAARNVGANMITNGIIEVEMEKGKITKITRKAPALAEVFGFLNNKSDNYKEAYFDYLLHRHNISRMDLPFETKANAEQIAILTEARNKNEISQKLYDTLTNSNITTSHSKVRDMIYEHEGKMTQTTLDTILDLMGDQKPVFGKNVTAQDSEAQVKKYEQTNPEFKAQAEKVYQYNNALLDEQVKAGLITQETADYFRRTYPNYVPTHRFPKGASRSGLSVNTVQTGINTATGSERVIIDISEQMFNQTMKVSQAIAMNDMLKELGNNADGIDVQLYSEERITDASQIDTEDVGKRNKFSYFDIDVDKNGKRVVKKKSILVSDGMADSIRSALPQTNNETTSKGIKYLRKANVSFKKLTTSLNPFFSFFRNPLRDMQNALIYTKYGIKTFAKNYGRAIREIRSNGAYYQAYLANGGEFSSFYNFEESIKVETKRKGVGKALNKLEEWSNIIEQYPRLAEFISSIEAGNSMEQALLDSADITVNFGRSGIITKWANGTFMPYFNARMQGALKFTRNFEGIMTRQGQKQLAFVLAKMVLLGIGTSLLNDFMYGDDEEYKEMRVDDKSNNFLFKIGGKWIKIPRSEVTTSLASVFNRSKEAREGDEQAFKGFTKDVWNSFSPVQNMRTIFSPIIDAKTNTTWYGGKIEGAKFDNVRPRDRYDESTSSIAKFIGQALNVSPKKVHYVLDQYSGILGDLILPATSQKYSTSVIGKNLTVDPTTSNKYSQRFYNALEKAQYDKSSGDMLAKGKVRYLNKAQDALRELYNAQREVNNNAELSNKEKKEQYEILQVMINNVQKNAVESLKRFSDVLSNFALTDDSFEEDYREATRITFGAETALMNYDKRIYEKAKALYEQGVPYDIYYCVYFDTKEFEGDFDYNGNYIKGSKQIMVWNYINRLNIPKAQKILLYEALGYTYSTKTSNATNDKNPFKAYGS